MGQMPAWATVVITLGAAAIGALAGVVGAILAARTSQLTIEHQERESWRTRRLEAVQEFVKLGNVTTFRLNIATYQDAVDLDEFHDDLTSLREAQALVWLTFGKGSATGLAAEAITDLVIDSMNLLDKKSPLEARTKVTEAEGKFQDLFTSANEALDPQH